MFYDRSCAVLHREAVEQSIWIFSPGALELESAGDVLRGRGETFWALERLRRTRVL